MSTDSPSFAGLVRLCHRRWTIRLVAAMRDQGGGRFAVLMKRLGVARQTLKRSLDAAIEAGLVVPNPGYGHPLRPEYLLTDAGLRLADSCVDVVLAAEPLAADLAGRKWTLPVLAALHDGPRRFTDLEVALETATPRALTTALDGILEARLGVRRVERRSRVRARYLVHPSALGLARSAQRLAMVAGVRDAPGAV